MSSSTPEVIITNGVIPNLEFTKISSFVSLYTPPPSLTKPNPTDPTTILFCTWMGASPRSRSLHAAYHKHHALYPSARIILVRTSPDWFTTTPNSTRRKQVSPAVSILAADPSGDQKRILVHYFSNGGGVAFFDIATLWKAKFGELLKIKAMIIDSAPGNPTIKEAWAAMRLGVPKGLLWYPAAGVIWIAILVIWVQMRVLGMDSLIDRARKGMLDGGVVDREARRLYVYSVKDEICGWKVIEGEVEKARKEGVVVKTLREEETPHVQHMAMQPESYWGSVEKLWESTRG